jgi:type IV secretory pathway VirB10-like protein
MNRENKKKVTLFATLPKVARFKKSVLISALFLGALMLFVIFNSLSTNESKSSSQDVLENESENTHWLASSGLHPPTKNDPPDETKPSNTADPAPTGDTDSSLTMGSQQEVQLAKALKALNYPGKTTGINQLEYDQADGRHAANSSPIQIANVDEKETHSPQENKAPLQTTINNTLPAGNLIPIIFITKVNSELPGFALAAVTRDVSNEQRKVIIPQGTKILLQYESTNSDAERLAYKGVSMTLPNGKSISLDNLPVVDTHGRAGLQDKSNHHHLRNSLATLGNITSNQAGQIIASQLPSINSNGTNMTMLLPMSSANYFTQKGSTFYIRMGYECNLLLTHTLLVPLN